MRHKSERMDQLLIVQGKERVHLAIDLAEVTGALPLSAQL